METAVQRKNGKPWNRSEPQLQLEPHQPRRRFRAAAAAEARRDHSGSGKAELLEHSGRSRIIEEVRAFEADHAERSGDRDERGAGLGGNAAAPIGARYPIAELDRAR